MRFSMCIFLFQCLTLIFFSFPLISFCLGLFTEWAGEAEDEEAWRSKEYRTYNIYIYIWIFFYVNVLLFSDVAEFYTLTTRWRVKFEIEKISTDVFWKLLARAALHSILYQSGDTSHPCLLYTLTYNACRMGRFKLFFTCMQCMDCIHWRCSLQLLTNIHQHLLLWCNSEGIIKTTDKWPATILHTVTDWDIMHIYLHLTDMEKYNQNCFHDRGCYITIVQ